MPSPRRRIPEHALRRVAATLLALTLSAASGKAQEPKRVGYLFSDGQVISAVKAYEALLEERPDLRGKVEVRFLTESLVSEPGAEEIAEVDVLVLDIMNQQMLERFDEEQGGDLLATVTARGEVLGVGVGLLPEEHYAAQGVSWDPRARGFWQASGAANQLGLLKLAFDRAGIEGLEIPDVEKSLDFGFYLPPGGAGEGRVFAKWEDFAAAREAQFSLAADAPRVAFGFYSASFYGGDMAVVDAVIREIARQGAAPVPIFGYPGHVAFERLLLDEDGSVRADVGLALLFRFAQPASATSLAKLDIPILNLATLYGRTQAQWRASDTGLSAFEGTFQVASPEFAGLLSPLVVGSRERSVDANTGARMVRSTPIAPRIVAAVERALAWARLRATPNEQKRVAVLFYNYPPGKASIGASYLNVAESLSNILRRLRAEGYDLGGADLSVGSIERLVTEEVINVAGLAKGDLERLASGPNAVKVDFDRYGEWLGDLSPVLRREVLTDWGAASEVDVMAVPEQREIVLPVARLGNVAVLPQPARGWGEDLEDLYHADDLAPPHQYVAAYAWLRHELDIDAMIHIGTHGTLEWLDGKEVGLSADDASDALLFDRPHLYVYNVDVVGEGLVARRRSAAALVDHMVPPFRKGGLYAELALLSERIDDHDTNLSKNRELAAIYAEEIRSLVVSLGIAKDLGLELAASGTLDHHEIHEIQDYLRELEEENIPYGLHALGRLPEPEHRASTTDAIASADPQLRGAARAELETLMEERIVASAELELDRLVAGLEGKYLPGGNGGEPIRNPDVYPTGKNFYGIDPDKIPKPAAYRLGVELAEEMLADHVSKNGRYPEKVSFVIWGDETMRHEGILESQIFHLLGTRPVWDARGNVVDVEVIPAAELGRPRIDIVISSAAEGMFFNLTRLMDRAVQKVKVIEEAGNLVRRNYLQMRSALVEIGYSEAQADAQASIRIFDEPPGTHNLNTSRIVEESGTWESDAVIGHDYLRKMGHGYGNGFWGEPMEDAFRLALAGTEKVVHSSSTMLYGALDNDDFYMYMGGLASAIKSLDGTSPELVVTNTRNPAKPEMTSLDEFLGREMKSRYVNPRWIAGMVEEGYAGASEMRAFVEHLWGWEATVDEVVDDPMWSEVHRVYVEDRHEVGLREFFEESSPFAFQDIVARLLETVRKGGWDADEATRKRLVEEMLASVEAHGINCTGLTCGNPRLLRFIQEEALRSGVPTDLVETLFEAVRESTQTSLEDASQSRESFITSNESRIERREELARRGRVPSDVVGYLMESVSNVTSDESTVRPPGWPSSVLFGGALVALLFFWRSRYRASL